MEKVFLNDTRKGPGLPVLKVLDSQTIEEELLDGIGEGMLSAYGEGAEGEEKLSQVIVSVKVSIVGLFLPASGGPAQEAEGEGHVDS